MADTACEADVHAHPVPDLRWQVTHIADARFDFARNLPTVGSIHWLCGSWQETHCTNLVPVSSWTGSPAAGSTTCASDALRANDTGWSFDRSVPRLEVAGTNVPPAIAIVPSLTVAFTAIVPSWQLRQSLADPDGCGALVPENVLNVPGVVPDWNELLP